LLNIKIKELQINKSFENNQIKKLKKKKESKALPIIAKIS